jgi:4-hydroxy-2-oxoheptanedioate aldolase
MRFSERLRSGPPLVATFSMIASPIVVELLARAAFDAVVFDAEHGPLGPEALNVLIPAASGAGIAPIVRVRANEPSLIGGALDIGAAAVLVPQVESPAQAAAAVSAARFGPGGRRGTNPYVRAAGYGASPDWFSRANDESAVLVMVEGAGGIGSLDGILATPGLDGVFIGPFDLSQSLGVPGQIEHPGVLARVEAIVRVAAGRQVATAVFAPTPPLARRWLELGVRLVAVSFDTALALEGFRTARAAVGSG